MIKFLDLYEDSQHAGYKKTLDTPRPLGDKDLIFVGMNVDRKAGETVLDFEGKEIKKTKILQNTKESFQYVHVENANEVHIESVEMYRDLWISIHVPAKSVKYIGK